MLCYMWISEAGVPVIVILIFSILPSLKVMSDIQECQIYHTNLFGVTHCFEDTSSTKPKQLIYILMRGNKLNKTASCGCKYWETTGAHDPSHAFTGLTDSLLLYCPKKNDNHSSNKQGLNRYK